LILLSSPNVCYYWGSKLTERYKGSNHLQVVYRPRNQWLCHHLVPGLEFKFQGLPEICYSINTGHIPSTCWRPSRKSIRNACSMTGNK
jgi:hypothetical protein